MRLAAAILAAALVLPGWVTATEYKDRGWTVWKTGSAPAKARTFGDLRIEASTDTNARGQRIPVLTLSGGARPKMRISGEEGHASGGPAAFGVFRLDRAREAPVVLFSSYSLGAHCCDVYRAIYADGATWTVRKLGAWHASYAPQVRDVDGDGRLELVGRDQRFAYAFTSYAESVPPAQVWELVDGALVDVSSQPRYRRVFERELGDLRAQCLRERARGYCASYAATAARLGRLGEAGKVLDQAFPPRTDGSESAPIPHPVAGGPLRKTFPTFREAVTWYLGELKYPTGRTTS